jgi:hypothetical protein
VNRDELTKMVPIPLPSVGNVAIVVSDGTGYISSEVPRDELVQDGAVQEALNYLDAELIDVDRPNARLRASMEDVIKFREGRDG